MKTKSNLQNISSDGDDEFVPIDKKRLIILNDTV